MQSLIEYPLGQIFRVPPSNTDEIVESEYPNLRVVTRGAHGRGMDIQKGIFFYKAVVGPDSEQRRPAFIFSSNNLEKADQLNPWLDIIDDDIGYALYHGDNKEPGRGPLQARGNREFVEVLEQYGSDDSRQLAAPVLLMEHVEVGGRRKGYRRFVGYGVPTDVRIQTQVGGAGHFLNLAIELALLGLEHENGRFPWSWIDDRRNPKLSASQANARAPLAWRNWVRHGYAAIPRFRHNTVRGRLIRTAQQRSLANEELRVLQEVVGFYEAKPHGFEGLASWVTGRVLGPRCHRGWVTQRSGDGGIDYVSRLDIGHGISLTSLVVLGQAKVRGVTAAINGEDLARVVARLRRGWVGAFVTTGIYSENAQAELIADDYPVLLVNGRLLARELIREQAESGVSPAVIAARETDWYERNASKLPPQHIVSSARAGLPMWSSHGASIG